jgi:hypothetical protein
LLLCVDYILIATFDRKLKKKGNKIVEWVRGIVGQKVPSYHNEKKTTNEAI